MVHNHYDTAIFGSTFLGLGAALSLENAVVLDNGGLFGAEFVNSYKVNAPKVIIPKTTLGHKFSENLKKRGLMTKNGEIYQAPAVYVLSEYLKDKAVDILLMTEVTEIKKENGYFQITVYHTKGFETIEARNIIDTTTLGIGHEKAKSANLRKSLNAILYNPEHNDISGITYNSASGLFTYSMPVDLSMPRYNAVEALCEMEAVFYENKMRISSIAPEFSYDMDIIKEDIDMNFTVVPSVAYGNLLEAFDMGVCIGRGEVLQ